MQDDAGLMMLMPTMPVITLERDMITLLFEGGFLVFP